MIEQFHKNDSVNLCLSDPSPSPLALVSATSPAATTAAALMLLLLVLREILSNAAQDSSSDGSQETMTGFFAQEVATEAATDGAEKTTITLSHRRSICVVVGGVGIRGLASKFVVRRYALALLALTALTELLLVSLILRVGVVAAILLLLWLLLAVVA